MPVGDSFSSSPLGIRQWFVQDDALEAARRAGPSATADDVLVLFVRCVCTVTVDCILSSCVCRCG